MKRTPVLPRKRVESGKAGQRVARTGPRAASFGLSINQGVSDDLKMPDRTEARELAAEFLPKGDATGRIDPQELAASCVSNQSRSPWASRP